MKEISLIAKHSFRVIKIHNGTEIMSNRFKKSVIDDVSSMSIDEALEASLIDLFESAMKMVATTLVRNAKFDVSDFASAKDRGCEGFALIVSRTCAPVFDRYARKCLISLVLRLKRAPTRGSSAAFDWVVLSSKP